MNVDLADIALESLAIALYNDVPVIGVPWQHTTPEIRLTYRKQASELATEIQSQRYYGLHPSTLEVGTHFNES
jgi:hypothetical protein